MSTIVQAGQLVGPAPDYWSGSGLSNQTVSSGLVAGLLVDFEDLIILQRSKHIMHTIF